MENQEGPGTEPIGFRDVLERHVINSGMTYRQIAGESYVQLWRALHGQRVDRDNLMNWCNELVIRDKITKQEANRLHEPGWFCHAPTAETRPH